MALTALKAEGGPRTNRTAVWSLMSGISQLVLRSEGQIASMEPAELTPVSKKDSAS